MVVSLSSIYRFNEIRKAIPEIDKIHKNIKDILNNKTISQLSVREQKLIQKELQRLKDIITETFKINVADIRIVESTTPNAMVINVKFIIPFLDNAHIIYLDKLIHMLNSKELTAVLLHEIGHTYYWFPIFLANLTIFSSWGNIISAIIFHIGMPFYFIIAWLLALKFTRVAEEYADRFVVEVGYHKYLISALHKLKTRAPELIRRQYISTLPSEDNQQEDKKDKNSILEFIKGIFSTHPNVNERICYIVQYTYDIAREKYKDNPKALTEIKKQLEKILEKYNLKNECKLE